MVSSVGWDGEHVYSYGYHYPLLIQIKTERGPVWILNDSGYSSTTGRHIHWARDYADYSVSVPRGASGSVKMAAGMIEAAEMDIKDQEETIKAAKERAELRPRYSSTYMKTAARAEERIQQLKALINAIK